MFKKFLFVLVVALGSLLLVSCGEEERTYKADGVYTAFSTELQGTKPQVTTVTVTVKDDKITDFDIDCYQSAFNTTTNKYAFKDPKKTLGFKYGMHNANDDNPAYTKQDLTTTEGLAAYQAYLTASNQKEWFQQAELLEAYFLANDPATVTTDATSKAINNVTGVTIKDGGYTTLATEAIQLAKDGKAQTVLPAGDSVSWATAMVKADGSFESLQVNTLQGTYSVNTTTTVKDVFAWNAKNKQELGYLYGMHNPKVDSVPTYDLTTTAGMDAYKAYLTQNNKKEWFEQANILTDFVLANGFDKVVVGTNNKIDAAASDTALASVSVTANAYVDLLKELYDNFK